DFSQVPQFYCTGDCSPIGGKIGALNCDQEDADLFCQLITGNAAAIATAWEQSIVIAEPGFCCLGIDDSAIDLGPQPDFGIPALCYQPSDMTQNHEFGYAILAEEIICE
ncbi:MAG: hypothetical protein KDA51_17540, partial [Planctomycetales bacterium]|nr:hypothetical protein [Planctomycetales bacterium]